jgi:thioredoxin 1
MVKSINKQDLQNLCENTEDKIIILDFYASWCEPCNLFAPIFEKISVSLEEEAIFRKINIDEEQELAVFYQITSIPTLIMIKNKEVIWKHVGSIQEEVLIKKIEDNL